MTDRELFTDVETTELALVTSWEHWARIGATDPGIADTPLQADCQKFLAKVEAFRAGVRWLSQVAAGKVVPSSAEQWAANNKTAQDWMVWGCSLRDRVIAHIDGADDYQAIYERALGSHSPEAPRVARAGRAA